MPQSCMMLMVHPIGIFLSKEYWYQYHRFVFTVCKKVVAPYANLPGQKICICGCICMSETLTVRLTADSAGFIGPAEPVMRIWVDELLHWLPDSNHIVFPVNRTELAMADVTSGIKQVQAPPASHHVSLPCLAIRLNC